MSEYTRGFKLLTIGLAFGLLAACSSTNRSQTAAPVDTSASDASAGNDQGVGASDLNAPAAGSLAELIAEAGADRVFFAFDSAELSSAARAVLNAQANWLKRNANVAATVEGHCDERGTREYNLALGERRATAVREYLVALGVSGSQLSTISYGKERPEVLGSNDDSWSKNRRGVLTLTGAAGS